MYLAEMLGVIKTEADTVKFISFLFLKKNFYLLLFRERGREGEKETEEH